MFYFLLAMVNIIDIVNMNNKKIKGGNMIIVEHVKSKILKTYMFTLQYRFWGTK